MSGLRVYLFGAPHLEKEGSAVPFGRSKGLALLAYLALNANSSRESLLELLYPTFAPDDARNNLRRELSLLKKVLPAGVLTADRQAVILDPHAFQDGRIEVDVLSFEAGLKRAAEHRHPAGGLCEVCAQALESAVAHYQHDFLSGFSLPDSPSFDEWQYFQTERLRNLAGEALSRLVEWRGEKGDIDGALPYARRRLALEPTHEPTHRALMQFYEATGQHAAALRQYELLARLLREELGVAPETATNALLAAIQDRRTGDAPPVALAAPAVWGVPIRQTIHPPEAQRPHNLPAESMPFIGRERELELLDAALDDPTTRLITIVGPGGIGKTRLALAAAARQLQRPSAAANLADGVYLVPLAPVDSGHRVIEAIGRALDLSLHNREEPARELANLLRRRRLLLVIDNIEHLIADGAVHELSELLAGAPYVRLLVTSRVQLRTKGEHLIPLSGLALPAPKSWAASSASPSTNGDALALFLAIARRVQPDFEGDPAQLLAAARICRLVQGMPLAIELAGGWLSILSAEEIAAELERNPDFLEANWSDVPARQANLQAVFDTSWQLLTAEEQAALRALSVFRGGFGRDAAHAVAGASLKMLAALVAKSWLTSLGPDRLQIHELLRQYAARELQKSPVVPNPRQSHADYYAGLADAQLPRLRSPHPAPAYTVLDNEADNIQSAIGWLVEHDAVVTVVDKILPVLFRFLESRFHYYRYYPLRELALERARTAGIAREEAILLIWDGAFFFNGYPTRFIDYPWVDESPVRGVRMAWESINMQPGREDFWDILMAWEYSRFVDPVAAVARMRYFVTAIDRRERPWEWAFAQQSLGRLLARSPAVAAHVDEARQALYWARTMFDELGDKREAAVSTLFLAYDHQTAGDLTQARTLMNDAQAELQMIGDDIIALSINWPLADMYMQLGETDRAMEIFVHLANMLIQNGHAQLAIDSLSRAAYESARYQDIHEARRLRERSLAMSQAFGYQTYESWDNWEMGEVYRLMGDATAARQWYDRAMALFGENNQVGRSFYLRGLGDLALARGAPNEAARHFEQSRRKAEAANHPWQVIYLTIGLARAALLAGDQAAARRHLMDALRRALDNDLLGGLATAILHGAVELSLAKGHQERAEKLGLVVLAHPLAWRETRRAVAGLLRLPYKEDETTKRPAFDLAPLLAELLAELEG